VAVVGLAVIALGYAVWRTGFPSPTLIHPLWLVGVCALLTGSAGRWDWGVFESRDRWTTLVLSVATTLWGVTTHQGLFTGAGGTATIVWGLAVSVELCKPLFARKLWQLVALLVGAMLLGLTWGIEANWALVTSLLAEGV
jgi:hypothetical protein